MNRTISMLTLVMLLAGISSANKAFGQTNPEVALMSDSVSTEFGKAAGTVFGYRAANDSSIDRDVFLRGFDSVVKGDTTTSFITGLQMGLVIMDNIRRVEREGLTFDMATFLREFYQAFGEGMTMQEDQVEAIGSGINGLMNRATLVARKNDPKVIETLRAGEAFIAQKAAEGYTRTASGVLYRITEPGEGEPCTGGAMAIVNFVGRHLDGEIFQESDEEMPLEYFEPVAGIAELEPLMKAGMKLVAVVPADLAYGYEGQSEWGNEWIVSPGETLIYEIEVVSIYDADKSIDGPESEE